MNTEYSRCEIQNLLGLFCAIFSIVKMFGRAQLPEFGLQIKKDLDLSLHTITKWLLLLPRLILVLAGDVSVSALYFVPSKTYQ